MIKKQEINDLRNFSILIKQEKIPKSVGKPYIVTGVFHPEI